MRSRCPAPVISPADGSFHAIGKVAAAANVSVQTIRLWERLGHLNATRTAGGQRLFSDEMLRTAVEFAISRRRARDRVVATDPTAAGLAATGARIKRARLERGLTQAEASAQTGISRSFLASVERGETGVSMQTLARLADVFLIPMSRFADDAQTSDHVMRPESRPRTMTAGGVCWEELAAPGRYDLEPAVLIIPSGQTSGGFVVRPGTVFVYVLRNEILFEFNNATKPTVLSEGDALTVPSGLPFAWHNDSSNETSCLWIEVIIQS